MQLLVRTRMHMRRHMKVFLRDNKKYSCRKTDHMDKQTAFPTQRKAKTSDKKVNNRVRAGPLVEKTERRKKDKKINMPSMHESFIRLM